MILPCGKAEDLCLHCVCASAELTNVSRHRELETQLLLKRRRVLRRKEFEQMLHNFCCMVHSVQLRHPLQKPCCFGLGLSCTGFITGCRIESEEGAEFWGRTANCISSAVMWVLTVSASGLRSAGMCSLGELCAGCGIPCSSYRQEPGELKWKVNAASSAHVLCQQFEVSYCTGFQILVFQMEMQVFSVSVFSLLRLTLRKVSASGLWL